MKILLTRHGQTDWNVLGKIQGCTDTELNQTGIEQAKIAREKLLNYDIDIIITSPLKRAKKTAEIINEGRNIPLTESNGIIERNFGEFEGKTAKEFNFDEIWNYKLNKKYENAESVLDVFDRVENFLYDLKEKYPDKTVLLVTHGGISVPIRAHFEGIPEGTDVLRGLGLENCEIREYEM